MFFGKTGSDILRLYKAFGGARKHMLPRKKKMKMATTLQRQHVLHTLCSIPGIFMQGSDLSKFSKNYLSQFCIQMDRVLMGNFCRKIKSLSYYFFGQVSSAPCPRDLVCLCSYMPYYHSLPGTVPFSKGRKQSCNLCEHTIPMNLALLNMAPAIESSCKSCMDF